MYISQYKSGCTHYTLRNAPCDTEHVCTSHSTSQAVHTTHCAMPDVTQNMCVYLTVQVRLYILHTEAAMPRVTEHVCISHSTSQAVYTTHRAMPRVTELVCISHSTSQAVHTKHSSMPRVTQNMCVRVYLTVQVRLYTLHIDNVPCDTEHVGIPHSTSQAVHTTH